MNKILFSLILSIIIATNMSAFPVYAMEKPDFEGHIVVENLNNEESSDDSGEKTVIENDSGTASENETIDEGVTSVESEEESGTGDTTEGEAGTGDTTEEETGTGNTIEEEAGTEDTTEEEVGTEDKIEEEAETEDKIEEEAGTEDKIEEEAKTEDTTEEEAGTGDTTEEAGTEDVTEEETETDDTTEEETEAGAEDVAEVTADDPAALPGLQAPAAEQGVGDTQENVDTAATDKVYARPVIKRISTDGKSITLEWDNAEGALFQIYRWNILPYVIGTSTTGSFVDTNVTYGRSYTYFIATSSPAYRYPYSQTVSKWVRRPIEDIDEEHRIGEDLSWSPAEREHGGKSLVISGNGNMPDFSSPSETPWHDNAGEIRHISIDDGVTYVGDNTFSDMDNLQEVSLPSSVREYGHDVFRGSTNLEYFNHDSAVDADLLHIAVQYLTGIYSGQKFEPEVRVRKGADGGDFERMPELIRGTDYTVTYNNTTEVGEGTIEITFIGDYADADSVVIPFIVVSELRKEEKIKTVTGIELLPASSTYTGFAQHPATFVRSGRWILKEGVDYILTYTDMVDVGSYTVTAQGIGAYSGEVQAVYTILQQKQSADPWPSVKPSAPDSQSPVKPSVPAPQPQVKPSVPGSQPQVKPSVPGSQPQVKPSVPGSQTQVKPSVPASQPKVKPSVPASQPQVKPSAPASRPQVESSDPAQSQNSYAFDSTSQETAQKASELNEERTRAEEEYTEDAAEPDQKLARLPSIFDSKPGGDPPGNGGFSLGDRLVKNNSAPVRFFVGAVGILASICVGVYLWFFHWFLHRM